MAIKIKNVATVILIILLLPFVITNIVVGNVENEDNLYDECEKIVILNNNVSIPLEEYVIGVVASQISIYNENETIKAQSVIARTEVLKQMNGASSISEEDLTTTYMTYADMKKLWGESNAYVYYNRLIELTNSTKGMYMVYDDEIIEPLFHVVSSGNTRGYEELGNGNNMKYLAKVECEDDLESKEYLEILTFTVEEVCEKLEIEDKNDLININYEYYDSGYVKNINIGDKVYTSEEFIKLFDLNSTCFDIAISDNQVKLTSKGKGHGFGLSQYGANELAMSDMDYEEILKYYYQNISIISE